MVSLSETEQAHRPDAVDLNAFPLGGDVVVGIFERLHAEGKSINDLFKGFMNVTDNFQAAQYEAATYLFTSGEEVVDKEVRDRLYAGHLLFYATLMEKFGKTSIPSLSEEFVDDYEIEKAERVGQGELDLGVPYNEDGQVVDLFRNLGLFRLIEKDTARAIEDGVRQIEPDYPSPETDYFMAGFSQAYFLFRIGLSDPKNFELGAIES